jgi:hypothetical protein
VGSTTVTVTAEGELQESLFTTYPEDPVGFFGQNLRLDLTGE